MRFRITSTWLVSTSQSFFRRGFATTSSSSGSSISRSVSIDPRFELVFQEWGRGNPNKVLAVHGWLDNSSSFCRLASQLALKGYHVVAMDNAGHGKSNHLSNAQDYCIATNAKHAHALVTEHLNWNTFHLIGHSMGSAVCLKLAVEQPSLVRKVVIMELFGPVSLGNIFLRNITSEEQILQTIRTATPRDIPSLADAIRMKQKAVTSYAKQLTISDIVCVEILERNSELIPPNDATTTTSAVRITTDPKLSIVAYLYFSKVDILSYLSQLKSKLLVIDGETGWPITDPQTQERVSQLQDQLAGTGQWTGLILPGSHHLHADPETEPVVSDSIIKFLSES